MEYLKPPGKFISKKAFIAFLKKEIAKKAKPYKCDATNCPLARATGFAVDQYHYTLYPELRDSDIYHENAKTIVRRTPEWASTFVSLFDETDRPKTAKTALMIMNQEEEFENNGGIDRNYGY